MEVFLADLLNEQRKQGIDAHALVHGDPEPDDPPWIQRVPVQFSLVYAPMAAGFRSAMAKAIERIRPDVLHLHLPNNSALWALTLPSARKVPWVIHWQSDIVFSDIKWSVAMAYMIYKPFEQALLERTAQIIATSPPYLEASKALRSWHDKTAIIPLGINVEAAPAPVNIPPEMSWRGDTQLKLLSIGRLTYYKGFETLIEAVSTMPGVELLIVGEGELRPDLEAKIKEVTRPGQPPTVCLLGAVDDAQKHTLLAQCDVFCLASCERTEAFGIVVLEAMMHGRPCVVTDLPGSGMPWIVAQAKSGLRVPYEDVHAWRSHIARMQHDPQLRKRFGEAGVQAIKRMFSIGPCEREISRYYRGLAPESVPPFLHKGVMVVVSARNQEKHIAHIIKRVNALAPTAKVVVVDNRSTDATSHLAESSGAIVLRPLLAMTTWGALQTGLRYAQAQGFEMVVTIDADSYYEVEELPTLLSQTNLNPTVDLSVAFFPARHSFVRRMAWKWYRLLTGFELEDFVSGFRVYRRKAIDVAISSEATLLDYQDVGTYLLMRRQGLKLKEVPLQMHTAKEDKSSIFRSWAKAVRYFASSTLMALAHGRKRSAP
ncbi:glycosyltransferase [Diaphorobacter sp. HDW4A]|uniref:glycosyltransferase n=1 Tax=Diaphorobacter sp. HDW4A TaxID=2714924 RepID=UPI00140E7539|nr:glycosyltransferase [Diaphorobacter sp. HDW4A]QIL83967.1 glycosyltransferase [Diaphorobacter sp. HDW4A]